MTDDEPTMRAIVWHNPLLGKWIATPAPGEPGAEDLFASGETEQAALDALLAGVEMGALE